MSTSDRSRLRSPRLERGVTAVELSIVVSVFLMLVLGMVDFGRWLFAINSAVEATREGARVAVVCDLDDADIQRRMQTFLVGMTSTNAQPIRIAYSPAGCSAATCASVSVSLRGYQLAPVTWFLPARLPVPQASTFLPRESLSSTDNPRCR